MFWLLAIQEPINQGQRIRGKCVKIKISISALGGARKHQGTRYPGTQYDSLIQTNLLLLILLSSLEDSRDTKINCGARMVVVQAFYLNRGMR